MPNVLYKIASVKVMLVLSGFDKSLALDIESGDIDSGQEAWNANCTVYVIVKLAVLHVSGQFRRIVHTIINIKWIHYIKNTSNLMCSSIINWNNVWLTYLERTPPGTKIPINQMIKSFQINRTLKAVPIPIEPKYMLNNGECLF